MAIYTDSKGTLGGQTPHGAGDTSWNRTEPLLTPEDLVALHLFGLPLVSGVKDPFTGKAAVMTPGMLSKIIDRAVSEVETLAHIEIMPVQITTKLPFDPQLWASQGFTVLPHRPVASVESVEIVTSDNTPVFRFDLNWIEVGQLHQGILSILPFLLMFRGASNNGFVGIAGSAAGTAYLSLFGGTRWVASLIEIKYTVGFKDGLVPRIVNEVIGVCATMRILSMLAPTFGKANSASLSIGGLSQSTGGSGPQIFAQRMTELTAQRDQLISKLKSLTGQKLLVGNV